MRSSFTDSDEENFNKISPTVESLKQNLKDFQEFYALIHDNQHPKIDTDENPKYHTINSEQEIKRLRALNKEQLSYFRHTHSQLWAFIFFSQNISLLKKLSIPLLTSNELNNLDQKLYILKQRCDYHLKYNNIVLSKIYNTMNPKKDDLLKQFSEKWGWETLFPNVSLSYFYADLDADYLHSSKKDQPSIVITDKPDTLNISKESNQKAEALFLINWLYQFLNSKQIISDEETISILKKKLLTADKKPKPCLLSSVAIGFHSTKLVIHFIQYDNLKASRKKKLFTTFLDQFIFSKLPETKIIPFINNWDQLDTFLFNTQQSPTAWLQLIEFMLTKLTQLKANSAENKEVKKNKKYKETKNKKIKKKRIKQTSLKIKDPKYKSLILDIHREFIEWHQEIDSNLLNLLITDLKYRRTAYHLQASLKSGYKAALKTSRSIKQFNYHLTQNCSPILVSYQHHYRHHQHFRQRHFIKHPSCLTPPYNQRSQKGILNLTAAHFEGDYPFCFWLNPCKLPHILTQITHKASLIFNIGKKNAKKEKMKLIKIEEEAFNETENKIKNTSSTLTLAQALIPAIDRLFRVKPKTKSKENNDVSQRTQKIEQSFKWTTAIRNWFLSLLSVHSFSWQQQFRDWLYLCQHIHYLAEKKSDIAAADHTALQARVNASIQQFSGCFGFVTNHQSYLDTLTDVKTALKSHTNSFSKTEVINYTSSRVRIHMGLYVQPFEQIEAYLNYRATENFDNQGKRLLSLTDYLERFQSWTSLLITINEVSTKSDTDIKARLIEPLTQAINTFYHYGRTNRYATVLKDLLTAVREGRVFFHKQIKSYIQQLTVLHVRELDIIYKFRAWTLDPDIRFKESLFESLRTYQHYYQQYLKKSCFISANAALTADDAIYNAKTQTGILHKLLPPTQAEALWEEFLKPSRNLNNLKTNSLISDDSEKKKKLSDLEGTSNLEDSTSTSNSVISSSNLTDRISTARPIVISDTNTRSTTPSSSLFSSEDRREGQPFHPSITNRPSPSTAPTSLSDADTLSSGYDTQLRKTVETLINHIKPQLPTSLFSYEANSVLQADYKQLCKLKSALDASKFTNLSQEIIPIVIKDMVLQTVAQIKTDDIKKKLLTAIKSSLAISPEQLSSPILNVT